MPRHQKNGTTQRPSRAARARQRQRLDHAKQVSAHSKAKKRKRTAAPTDQRPCVGIPGIPCDLPAGRTSDRCPKCYRLFGEWLDRRRGETPA